MDVDMSLDDMIAAKPRAGGRRGGRTSGARPAATRVVSNGHLGGARERYAQGAVPSAQAVQSRQAAAATKVQNGPRNDDPAFRAVKIIISNLPLDVDDAAVRDLFQTTVGPTKECFLAYDKNGKHKGVATVVFQKFGDAQKAYKSYNNRLIDGRTPMKVEVVLAALPAPSLSSRVAPVVAAPVTYVPVAPAGQTGIAVPMAGGEPRGPRVGGAGVRRRGGAIGRGGGKTERPANRPKKTQEDLDAEMESWSAANAETTA